MLSQETGGCRQAGDITDRELPCSHRRQEGADRQEISEIGGSLALTGDRRVQTGRRYHR